MLSVNGMDKAQAYLDEALRVGPARVIINGDGLATSSRQARERYGILPDFILVRNDGWTLGAMFVHKEVAYQMWPNEWIGYAVRPETLVRSMHYWPDMQLGDVNASGT